VRKVSVVEFDVSMCCKALSAPFDACRNDREAGASPAAIINREVLVELPSGPFQGPNR
jgi:hypothetical protein